MAITTLEKVIEEVKALSLDEQRRLRELLDGWLTDQDVRSREQEAVKRLLADGVITRIPPPITDFTPYQNRKPIQVKGKPLSETIIEERR